MYPFVWNPADHIRLRCARASGRLFEPESRAAFYSALTRVLFSNDGASESCILQVRPHDAVPIWYPTGSPDPVEDALA